MIENLQEYDFSGDMKNGRGMETRRPVFIRKLCDRMGTQQAVADLLGCTRPTISRAITENLVTGIYEVAAEYAYKHKFERERGGTTFIVQVPARAMDDFTAALGLVAGVRVMKVPTAKEST